MSNDNFASPLENAALQSAENAWYGKNATCQFDPAAFKVAVQAFMSHLASANSPKNMSPIAKKAIETKPEARTPGEHFLAMCSGNYIGYTLTDGKLPDGIARKVLCYQPDSKSSILMPLFVTVMRGEQSVITDLQNRPFMVQLTGGNGLSV